MYSLESPHRGDSNEYTQYTIFNINKKNTLNYPKSAAMRFFFMILKNEFDSAVVNESSVFEPLKFHCILFHERELQVDMSLTACANSKCACQDTRFPLFKEIPKTSTWHNQKAGLINLRSTN